jgi:hypothetical protein
MPKVIYNKLTGDILPDTAENRIATYRTEFNSDYHKYKQKYEILSYGTTYMASPRAALEKAGLWEEHKRILKAYMAKGIAQLEHEYNSLKQESSGSAYVNYLISSRVAQLEDIIDKYKAAYNRPDCLKFDAHEWEDCIC